MQQNHNENIEKSTGISGKNYKILGILIIFSALMIRLFDLGERVFHHDESVHGSFTLKLLENGQYSYDPAYHGPFLFHSTALVFHFLGINDTTARLVPVLFGVASIAVLFLLNKELGRTGVLWSAFLLTYSPSMVYFSRFFRNDLIIIFCTLATVAGGVRYLENLHNSKRYSYLILAASSLAIAVSSKENAYMIILIFGAYSGIYLLYRFYTDWKKEKLSLKEALRLKSSALLPFLPELLLAGILFLFIAMFFYTSLFRNDVSPLSVVEKAFSHWMEMHRLERIGGPFYYYIPILLVYESPIVIFGILGLIHFLKKKEENFLFFLSYWAVASLLLYSYLQEKVPWLVVHIVLPFGILAGAYLGELFPPGSRNRQEYQIFRKEKNNYTTGENSSPGKSRTHIFLAVILALTVGIFLIQCISVNFYRSMEPDELMTHTQASPDIRDLMKKIERFNRGPETLNLYIVDPDNLYWPLPWYLRNYGKATYSRTDPTNIQYDAIIVPMRYQMYKEIPKEEYLSYNFTLRQGKEFTLYYNKNLEN